MIIEHSVYPDLAEPPDALSTPEERADYVARICGAWDFGIVPERATFELFLGWRDVFDAFPIYASPAFAAFRTLAGWGPLAANPMQRAEYEDIDARDRGPDYADPCASLA